MRPRRLLLLTFVGCVGAALVTLGIASHAAGWPATRAQLVTFTLAGESALVPLVSRTAWLVTTSPSAAERDVWESLLDGYSRAPHNRRFRVAVNPMSRIPEDATPATVYERLVAGWPHEHGEPRAAAAVHDFAIRNARPTNIRCRLPRGSRFIAQRELRRYNDRWGWERFTGSQHVDAYLSMSRVGFNLAGSLAVVYAEFSCGGLCGQGTYLILERKGGRWVVANSYLSWIS